MRTPIALLKITFGSTIKCGTIKTGIFHMMNLGTISNGVGNTQILEILITVLLVLQWEFQQKSCYVWLARLN